MFRYRSGASCCCLPLPATRRNMPGHRLEIGSGRMQLFRSQKPVTALQKVARPPPSAASIEDPRGTRQVSDRCNEGGRKHDGSNDDGSARPMGPLGLAMKIQLTEHVVLTQLSSLFVICSFMPDSGGRSSSMGSASWQVFRRAGSIVLPRNRNVGRHNWERRSPLMPNTGFQQSSEERGACRIEIA